jgi:hypothetical protein
VPKQVAVVGYDDHDICLGTYPSLTNNEVWYQPADLFRTVFMKDPVEKTPLLVKMAPALATPAPSSISLFYAVLI